MAKTKNPQPDRPTGEDLFPQQGKWIGLVAGFDPIQPRPQIRQGVEAHKLNPPRSVTYHKRYYGVRFWPERTFSGLILKTVCYACGAMWKGGWSYAEITKRGVADPELSYVMPNVDGGLLILDGKIYRCRCSVGEEFATKDFPEADMDAVEMAKRLDHKRAVEGWEKMKELGGASGLVNTFIESMEGKSIPDSEDSGTEEAARAVVNPGAGALVTRLITAPRNREALVWLRKHHPAEFDHFEHKVRVTRQALQYGNMDQFAELKQVLTGVVDQAEKEKA